jgi:hypothetical protein
MTIGRKTKWNCRKCYLDLRIKQSAVISDRGEQNTTIKTLNRIAQATNTRLHISFLTGLRGESQAPVIYAGDKTTRNF